jgi:regulator of replication initiation timing
MSELEDIVVALKARVKRKADCLLDDAAQAIVNLCEENDELRIDSKDIIEKLKSELNETKMERDYARREVCKAESSGRIGRLGTAQEHAKRMGWDCFKEAQP